MPPVEGQRIAVRIIGSYRTCAIPEVARLGRTLRARRQQILAYFMSHGVSTDPPTPSTSSSK